mgnify:CR=1 FL=1
MPVFFCSLLFSDDEYIIKGIAPGSPRLYFKTRLYWNLPCNPCCPERTNCIWRKRSRHGFQSSLSHRKLSITKRINLPAVNFLSLSLWQMDAAQRNCRSTVSWRGTVRNYLSSILEKLELRDRTSACCVFLSTFTVTQNKSILPQSLTKSQKRP